MFWAELAICVSLLHHETTLLGQYFEAVCIRIEGNTPWQP